jgi:hypothetical protein
MKQISSLAVGLCLSDPIHKSSYARASGRAINAAISAYQRVINVCEHLPCYGRAGKESLE